MNIYNDDSFSRLLIALKIDIQNLPGLCDMFHLLDLIRLSSLPITHTNYR